MRGRKKGGYRKDGGGKIDIHLGGDMSNKSSGSLSGVVPLRAKLLIAMGMDKGSVFSGRNECAGVGKIGCAVVG